MSAYSTPCDKGKPITLRLPRDGYQNNPDVVAIMSQPDEFLAGTKVLMETLYQKLLDPLQCPVEWLDYLGWLNGWSDEYWDRTWSASVKRTLISLSNLIWSGLGRRSTLETVLNVHTIEYKIWAQASLQMPFTLPATFRTPQGVIYLRMPLKYLRTGKLFKEAERTRVNFVPCTLLSDTVYEYFYLGYSQLGEPMFS